MNERTSATHPIQVPFLPSDALRLPGKVGLTFAPGKRHRGVTGAWARDLDSDLLRLRDVYATKTLVSLIEDHELVSLGIPTLVERAEALGLRVTRFPIVDASVPDNPSAFVDLVAQILSEVAAGTTVVVHCRGGLGRTGLVAAACLVAQGFGVEAAVKLVREVRPGAIETRPQEAFLVQTEAALRMLARP